MTTRRRTTGTGGKRAAIYIRVSSKEQVQGFSLAAQDRELTAFCAREGLDIVQRYADEGKSGLKIEGRESLQRLLADVKEGRAVVGS